MAEKRSSKSARSVSLFVVSQEPPPSELLGWPEDEAEAAALRAEGRRIGDGYRALLAAGHDEVRWRDATVKMLKVLAEYRKVHPDSSRVVGGRPVYSDHFRHFVLSLARGPGEGMTLAELAWTVSVPVEILNEWLTSRPSR